MRIVTDLAALERGKPAILTIGTFDGVHRGHQWLIRQVVERSRRLDYDSIVISFDPAPQVVLRPGSLQLTGSADKVRLIAAVGPSILALLPFTHDLSQIPAPEFLVSILDHINLAEIWTGADFVFGHNRGGNVDLLIRAGQNSGFAVHVVPRKGLSGVTVSSTRIRELVRNGDIQGAATLLGHYPSIAGTVVSGFGRGAQLGFPTANVRTPESQMLPANGIYAAYLRWNGKRYAAAVSVGYNVVFEGKDIVVEAYILDFAQDIREQEVGVDFVACIREEQNFDSVKELIAQMHRDVETVRAVLANSEEPGELLLD